MWRTGRRSVSRMLAVALVAVLAGSGMGLPGAARAGSVQIESHGSRWGSRPDWRPSHPEPRWGPWRDHDGRRWGYPHDPWWWHRQGHGVYRGWGPGYAPVWVPPQWVWNGWGWVLVPGYWR